MKYILIFVSVLCMVSASWFGYSSYQLHTKPRNDTENIPDLLKKVNRLTQLPREEPSVATVKDAKLLQRQSMFKNAQNGDKLIIYVESQKAYLYRPKTGKLIDILPVTATQSATYSESLSAPSNK